MEIALTILAIFLLLAGIAGCFLPGIPGPPLSLIALFLVQWAFQPFTTGTLVMWTLVVAIVTAADYWIPVWTSRKFGATKLGITGSVIGMVIGIIFTPVGMIAGLVAGAIIGDLIAGRNLSGATQTGIGALFGTLATVGIKLICSALISIIVIWKLIDQISF